MVVPPAAMFVFFIVSILENGGPKNQFLAPGSLEIDISEPGRYYLWHDYATLYRNHRYSLDPSLPNGLETSVKDANGLPLEFVSRSGMSANVGDYSKSSVGYVEIDNPVSLRIDISGDFEDRVLSFSPGIFDSIGIGFL